MPQWSIVLAWKEQPALCHAHAEEPYAKQSLDKPQVPDVQPFVLTGLSLTLQLIDVESFLQDQALPFVSDACHRTSYCYSQLLFPHLTSPDSLNLSLSRRIDKSAVSCYLEAPCLSQSMRLYLCAVKQNLIFCPWSQLL
jgi:hypothetical protein